MVFLWTVMALVSCDLLVGLNAFELLRENGNKQQFSES